MDTPSSPETPTRYGHYEILDTLGRGAMGIVYLAKDVRIGRRVALKAVHFGTKFEDSLDQREFFDRLRREAELCGMLQHPNIVTLYEAGLEKGAVEFLAFEYIEGRSLREIIREAGRLPLHEAFKYAEAILKGLGYAHSRGVIHRDIKPGNILVNSEGEAKIADFGVARPQDSTLTLAGTMIGTPSYMAPEQISGDGVSTVSDLFAVGALMYEMLTGAKPFAADDVNAVLYNVVHRNAAPPSTLRPELSPEVDAFVARLLEKKPADRYQSAAEALDALRRLRDVTPTVAPPPRRSLRLPWHALNVHPLITTLVIVVILIPLGFGVWHLVREANRGQHDHEIAMQPDTIVAKKNEFARAEALFQQGNYEEAVAAFEAFVAKYPSSVAATERLAEAKQRRDELAAATTTATAPEDEPGSTTVNVTERREKPKEPNAARRGWNTLRKKVKGIFN